MILRSIALALGQFGDPRFRRVLLKGLGASLALLAAVFAGLLWLLHWALGPETVLPLLGPVDWLDDLLSWGSLLVMLLLSAVLMIPIATAVTSLFLEEVAEAVEARHYPHLPPATPPGWGDSLRDGVNFLGVLIAANLLALVLYLVFAPFAPLIFWGLNGFLLGREYFQLAALRRMDATAARALRRRHAGKIWLAGVLVAVPLTVPVLNLAVPILGAASFTHLVNTFRQRPSG